MCGSCACGCSTRFLPLVEGFRLRCSIAQGSERPKCFWLVLDRPFVVVVVVGSLRLHRSLSTEIKQSNSSAVLDVLASGDAVLKILESAANTGDDNDAAEVEEERVCDKARFIRDLSHRLERLKAYVMGLPEWRKSVAARQTTHSRWLAIRRSTLSPKVVPHSFATVARRASAAATIQVRVHFRHGNCPASLRCSAP